jgi:hypothetical protein
MEPKVMVVLREFESPIPEVWCLLFNDLQVAQRNLLRSSCSTETAPLAPDLCVENAVVCMCSYRLFIVKLHLNPHRLLLPEVSGLLSASSSAKLYVVLFALGTVHKALVAMLVLHVVVVRIRVIGIKPCTAQVATKC